MLRLCGADIEKGPNHEFRGICLSLYPMISISPNFATCVTEMKEKVKNLKVSANSSLIL